MWTPSMVLAALAFAGSAAPPRHGDLPGDAPMVKYSTPVVRLYTDVGKARALEVVEDLTFMSQSIDRFFRSFDIRIKKDNPIRCRLFADLQDYKTVRRGEHTVGPARYAYFSPNDNRITAVYGAGKGPGRAARAALHRECARWIVHGYFSNPAPAWFDEALSRYFEGLEFDAHRNLITDCGPFARAERMRYTPLPEGEHLARFFDERPFDYAFARVSSGANVASDAFSTLAWAVVYYYLHGGDEETRALFRRFIQGMSTGRERSKLLLEDLEAHRDRFQAFFKQDLGEPLRRYAEAVRLREAGLHTQALAACLALLRLDPDNRAGLRLAAEVSFEAGRFMPSLAFWRKLAALDPKEIHFPVMICRALTEEGKKRGDPHTLEEAVKAGREAVKRAGNPNAEALAALAMAYHAQGSLREALACMRMAASLGGEHVEEHRERVRAYSKDVIEQDRRKRR